MGCMGRSEACLLWRESRPSYTRANPMRGPEDCSFPCCGLTHLSFVFSEGVREEGRERERERETENVEGVGRRKGVIPPWSHTISEEYSPSDRIPMVLAAPLQQQDTQAGMFTKHTSMIV